MLSVHHWNESLFTFTCTRGPSLRFESGHFVMVGIMVDGSRRWLGVYLDAFNIFNATQPTAAPARTRRKRL